MEEMQKFTYPSHDGVHKVQAVLWLPAGEPRAVVQLVHGVAEHIMRYDGFARFLAAKGFAVAGGDHLGHGRTAAGPEEYGFLGEQNGWKHLSSDVRALRVLLGERFPGLPFFLMGHSMGSFLARLYLIDWPGTISGVILSGTGQEPPLLVALGKFLAGAERLRLGPRGHSRLLDGLSLGGYNRQFRPARTRADWISRDTGVVDAYMADPFCSFTPTTAMFGDMMEGLRYIAAGENLRRMDPKTPVYLFSGARDPVGANGAGVRKVYAFFRDAGCSDLSMKLYPGARHEMLNEVGREQVYDDVLAWLEARLPASLEVSPATAT